ncbi:DUF835 domain-containing protein [Thermococcus waiotapuensis]|uniref:DUF835 domain-containing protein n=1 Tax=Thermococcus waiotapuensis TaxID=90909 RepID=A0AAE4NVT1_9EURY|nr:DUF835 domain-containing protein [Thermococcus waiotapuensis]MDV3104201.1 DUF835 domain-containing protein [Thermococcus waiotapuensis]
MGLTAPWYNVVYDAVLLAGMGYIWWFFLKRWNRYTAELKFFVINATIFLGLAFAGRLIDFIGDFYEIPHQDAALTLLYGVSILGVIYTMTKYVLLLESSYLPKQVKVVGDSSPGKPLKGAYIMAGSRSRVVDVLNLVRSLRLPTLVFTRNPHLYEGIEFAVPIWITQAADRGIPPTKLHVIEDQAIKFILENPGAVVLIDCLEYLLLYNEFPGVFKFLVNLKDRLLPAGAALIVVVDENALDEKQKVLLLREFEPL